MYNLLGQYGTRSRATGFTLLELMVGIAVLAVLLGVGVPALTQMLRSNQIAATTNELLGALNSARAEAAARGMAVSICAANSAQDGCISASSNTSWSDGWLIFTDRGGTAGTVDTASGDLIIHRSRTMADGLQLTTGTTAFLRFAPTGALLNPSTTTTMSLTHSQCSGSERRQITVAATGRVNSSHVACS